MGDFNPRNSRGGFRGGSSGSRGGFGGGRPSFGGRSGGFGGGRGGGFGGSRRPLEMHDATCSECGNKCQVPFRPTGSKPVYCSNCFGKNEGSGSFSPRSQERQPRSDTGFSEQLKKINEKLDKILQVLDGLEIDAEGDEEGDDGDSEEDSESNLHTKEEITT